MKNTTIQFTETGTVKPLMLHYLNRSTAVKSLIASFPSLQAFESQIDARKKYPIDRDNLVDTLKEQYEGLSISERTGNHIEKLRDPNTFTVTTGHQPCLFTGPLYFIIKILNTVKLADTLAIAYPGYHFVPVYWLGAEDHDFEEVNHFNLFGRTLKWDTDQTGSVGRFNTGGLSKVYRKFCEIINEDANADRLKKLFEKAYLENDTYGMATRSLVNEMFGNRGVVIIDGDHVNFKRSLLPVIEKELKNNIVHRAVTATNKIISEFGKPQVNPREINLFYLSENKRLRIIQKGDYFIFDGTDQRYSRDQLLELLHRHPEKFSPNVLLRPVYQELILPNLSYIGGTGEIAYWLQLKMLFEALRVPFPLLLVRNSFLFLNANQNKKLAKLGISVQDLFGDDHALIRKVVNNQDDEISFDDEHVAISAVMDTLTKKANAIDPSLNQVFAGEKQRILKSLYNLEKRAYKALKQKNEQKINQAKILKDKLFPGGGLQERTDNFSGFYLQRGEALFDDIYAAIDPINTRLNVLLPE